MGIGGLAAAEGEEADAVEALEAILVHADGGDELAGLVKVAAAGVDSEDALGLHHGGLNLHGVGMWMRYFLIFFVKK